MRFLAVLVGLLAGLIAVTGTAAAGKKRSAPGPGVVHTAKRAYIADGQGREVLLRGINSNSLVEYPDNFQQTIPLRAADFKQMAALGFNFLRLPINWSRLEPEPDRYSNAYLKEIRTIIRRARAQGMSTLVDFHQDRYNKNLRPPDEADGAPEWATETDGKPCTYGVFLTSPCSIAAYDHFWQNDTIDTAGTKPLQTHYLEAMIKVSRFLRREPGLLGLELMNEPTNGSVGSPMFERQQLWPFNRRMINGLRRDGEKRMLWFGPNIPRDALDFDLGKPEKFSNDRNLVYAPHIYTGTFNEGGPAELAKSVDNAENEARAYGAAWVDAEWGGGTDPKAESMRADKIRLLDEYRVGSGFWMWKQKAGFYNWHTVNEDGSLRQDSMRAQMLSAPHPDRIPGRIASTGMTENGHLRVVTAGRAGKARLWSGTVVYKGAETLLEQPLIRVFIDGKRIRPTLRAKVFKTDKVNIRGFRVFFKVPKGRHELVLKPAKPRWVKGRWVKGHWKKRRGKRVRWIKGHRVKGHWR